MPIKRSQHVRRRSSVKRWFILCMIMLVAVLLVVVFILTRGRLPRNTSGDTTTATTVQGIQVSNTGGTITADGFPVSQGWFIYNDKAYFGTDDGKLYVGDHEIDGTAYTFGTDGTLLNGWMQMGNLRYHFADGVMSKGTTEIDGKTCYLNSDGSMFVGWYDAANGYRLYYDPETGVALTGWHEIDGKHYCFDAAGFLYKGTIVDGVSVDENGAADEALYQEHISGKTQNTTAAGSTASRGTTVANKVDMTALNEKLDAILNKHGRTPRNIYDYVHDNYTYKHAPEGSIEENALYLLENGTGSCYHFASLTYMLFDRAGYDTRYVTGLGWQNHTYHCWIMANFDGGWYYVDSLYVRSAKLTADDLKEIGYEWDESAYPS